MAKHREGVGNERVWSKDAAEPGVGADVRSVPGRSLGYVAVWSHCLHSSPRGQVCCSWLEETGHLDINLDKGLHISSGDG